MEKLVRDMTETELRLLIQEEILKLFPPIKVPEYWGKDIDLYKPVVDKETKFPNIVPKEF